MQYSKTEMEEILNSRLTPYFPLKKSTAIFSNVLSMAILDFSKVVSTAVLNVSKVNPQKSILQLFSWKIMDWADSSIAME